MNSLNDPEAVRKEYADEKRYAARMAKQGAATGPDPYDVVFAAVAEREPRDVLEVGCGLTVESAGAALCRHFNHVEQRDVFGTVTFDGRQAAYEYLSATRSAEVADLLPDLAVPLVASRRLAVFVCAS